MSSINKIQYKAEVNGLAVSAEYYEDDVNDIFYPLIKRLIVMQKEKNGRLVAYLAAPPGTGKTTLSQFLEYLSEDKVQALGLDGFHYSKAHVSKSYVTVGEQKVPMANVKGCPESFDKIKAMNKIEAITKGGDVKWPIYDRKIHDSVDDVVTVDNDIVLIEGNYLLLDEPIWRELANFCDYSVFVSAEEGNLQKRLMERKIAGGASPKDARDFYFSSDCLNIKRVLNARLSSNLTLQLLNDGKFMKITELD